MSRTLRALAPGALVLAAAVAALSWFPSDVAGIVEDYALVAYGAGLALAWVFHRSRAFVALGLLIWLDLAANGNQALLLGLGTVVVGIVGVFGVLRDRGIVSRWGVGHALLASIVASGAGVLFSQPDVLSSFASGERFLLPGTAILLGYPVETVGTIAFALLGTLWGLYRYRGPLERALLWAVVMIAIAMHPALPPDGPALFLMAAGLTLTIGMVETSYVLAYQDELTGLPGRRALMQYLDELQGRYALAMVDVDHFKKFNDRHGHDVGDQVLKLVAGKLDDAPGGARAYRYGGEEFTLIFPGRTREEAWPYLEDVRTSIEQARFTIRSWKRPMKRPETPAARTSGRGRQLSVTVSLGVADTTADDSSPGGVLKSADEALYRAKNGGRNRVSA